MPAAIDDDLLFSPLRELAGQLKAGQLSPVDLATASLNRLETIGPKLGAVVTVTRERALAEARQAEAEIKAGRYLGPLHGIPFGAKDLLAAKGYPTTWGAAPYKEQRFDHDATVIRKLSDAGAVLAAKLALVELAGGFGYGTADASFTGPGRTPWNPDYWAGGSSSGSGAAVAAGLVPFSLGSETSGSIITPSTFCGVTGLRPTFGRVSRHGAMALSWSLDKIGPMARTADDCGLILAAIAGLDKNDPASRRRPFVYPDAKAAAPKDGKKYRVGIFKGSVDGAQPEVKGNFTAALKVIAGFADITDGVPFPDLPFGPVIGTIVSAEGASAFRDLIESGKATQLQDANDRWGGYAASLTLAVDYLQALRLLGKLRQELDKAYEPFDAILAPSLQTVSYPIAEPFDRAYPTIRGGGIPLIPANNACGQPAVCVPNGFGLHGLPTGLSFTGEVWSEARLIELANRYQQATDWHTKRPRPLA